MQKELPKKPFFRVDEVADYYCVTVRTVRNWINQGKIPAVRVGDRMFRVRREDVQFVEFNVFDRDLDAVE